VVATGEGWRNRFAERWGFPSGNITVIENGSELVHLLDRDQIQAFSKQSQSDLTNIVYVGAFEPWHGLSVLIGAISDAISRGVALRLVLVGTGSQEVVLKQMVRDLGITDQVVFTGSLSPVEFARHLANADIGVSPYCGRVEYSGLKLLDYKSAGLAIIASGKDGQPAVLNHGSTGWVVPPCDQAALCEAIMMFSTNVELRRRLGRQARMEAEEYHSWKHTAEQLEQLFMKLVADQATAKNAL
jgi:glycosyltransferase involved in cell wall biosynthesis